MPAEMLPPFGATDASAVTPEEERLAALRRGDPAAFEALVRSEAGRLLAATRRILGDEEEARDCVQETFVTAFRSLPGFKGDSALGTWLFRIAVNAALGRLRSRRRRPEACLEELLPRFHPDGHRLIPQGDRALPDPEEAMQRRELREMVRAAIDALPPSYRTVLLLREMGELSVAEVAAHLGLTPNAVKIRLHRARQALRELLISRGGEWGG